MSENEKKVIFDCFEKIQTDLQHPIDKHSKTLIVSNIELLPNYCARFYYRQFITREIINKGKLERFESLLKDYFESEKPKSLGLPTVAYCAEQLHLLANYFGDLGKKNTGKSPKEYIQMNIMDLAKEKIFEPRKSLSEIAYDLGFNIHSSIYVFSSQRSA